MIYQPAEDSYLLEKVMKDFIKRESKTLRILDMGSGSGIQALSCKDLGFGDVLAIDIDPKAVKNLREKGLKVIESDLFSNIYDDDQFDLIVFNAPYLPEDEREPEDIRLATTAGKKGYEIIVRFLKEAKAHLTKNGKILLLFSSLSQPKVILTEADQLGYGYRLMRSLKLDFEELFVYLFEK